MASIEANNMAIQRDLEEREENLNTREGAILARELARNRPLSPESKRIAKAIRNKKKRKRGKRRNSSEFPF